MAPVPSDEDVVYLNTYTPKPFMLLRHSTVFPNINLEFYIPSETHVLNTKEFIVRQFTYNKDIITRTFNDNEVLAQLLNGMFFIYIRHLNIERSDYHHYASLFTNASNEFFHKNSINHKGVMTLYNDDSCCWEFNNLENKEINKIYILNGISNYYWISTRENLHPNL